MNIQPLALARISDQLMASVTTSQMDSTQQQLLNVENELSTGKQFSEPSQNTSAAALTMELQRTLNQTAVYTQNLTSAQSQLGVVDNTLSSLTSLIQQAQNIASADVGSDVSQSERDSDAQVIDSLYTQAMSLANTQYNGAYLFGGDKNTTAPYVAQNGGVQFVGSDNLLQNTIAQNTNATFMVSGPGIFGASNSLVQGSTNLTPSLTAQTRLSDLRGATGTGVTPGAIQISNGTTTSLVDLTHADTIGDVVNAINAAGVGGVTASITGQGLTLTGAAADNITVSDVSGGTTAQSLGIAGSAGAAGTPLVGSSAEPNVTVFTPLSALNGGAGLDLHGITVTTGTQSTPISFAGATTVGDLLNDINSSGASVKAQIDSSGTGIDIVNPAQGVQLRISENGGTTAAELGIRTFSPQTPLSELNNGKGVTLASSGGDIKITPGNAAAFTVSFAGATTIQNVIDDINSASAGTVTASFSTAQNGIVLTDNSGGATPLTVSNLNGSTAGADLGLTQNAAVGGVLTGADVNPTTATGIFSDLQNLNAALTSGDQAGITAAATGLASDYQRVVDARGSAGAMVQQMQDQQDTITTQNTATQTLMSQLSDTDFTAAITQFQLLQTSLQATLEASAKTLNQSLLSFLG